MSEQQEIYEELTTRMVMFKISFDNSVLGKLPVVSQPRAYFIADLNRAYSSLIRVSETATDMPSLADFLADIKVARDTFQAYCWQTKRAYWPQSISLNQQLTQIINVAKTF